MTSAQAWTPGQIVKLRELYPVTSVWDLAPIFGRTAEAIKSRATLLHIGKANAYKEWTAADDWMMRTFFPHMRTQLLADRIGHPVSSVDRRAHKLGLRKTQHYLESPDACRLRRGDNVGAAFRYKKGQLPMNTGLRRPGYFRGRMRETQFKKGGRPRNYLPIGTLRTDSDGYLRRKIADGIGGFGNRNVWECVHRRVWEDAHGPIPRGHRIWWRDRNHENCSLENLELLTDADHMARTTIHNFPSPLREVIQLKGALKRRIRRMEEKENAEEHDRRSPQPSLRNDGSLAG